MKILEGQFAMASVDLNSASEELRNAQNKAEQAALATYQKFEKIIREAYPQIKGIGHTAYQQFNDGDETSYVVSHMLFVVDKDLVPASHPLKKPGNKDRYENKKKSLWNRLSSITLHLDEDFGDEEDLEDSDGLKIISAMIPHDALITIRDEMNSLLSDHLAKDTFGTDRIFTMIDGKLSHTWNDFNSY